VHVRALSGGSPRRIHWSITAWVLWIEDALLAAGGVDLNWIMRVD
jgi:hypothetical protein